MEKKLQRIKKNVWRLEEGGEQFAVKRYAEPCDALKIRTIHQQLEAVNYPYLASLSAKGNDRIVIHKWVTGARSADFTKTEDREASLKALDALHATNKVIDWQSQPFLQSVSLVDKWTWRLARFRRHRELLSTYLDLYSMNQLEYMSEQALNLLQTIQPDDDTPHTVLHGDVVHHNLLKTDDGTIFLIDFDLACFGHPDTEIALWMHRVLPNIGYQVGQLVNENPRLKSLSQEAVAMLQYPNEVLREWSHWAALPEGQQRVLGNHLVDFTKQALYNWPDVCRFSDNWLNQN